jgi:iron uptake system component EfeO
VVRALLVVAALGIVLGPVLLGTATAGAHGRHGRSGANSPHALAARDAGVAATAAYEQTVAQVASGFVADLSALAGAVGAGDVAGARTDELAAQGQFDAFRFVVGGGPSAAPALDGLAADVPPGGQLQGLHLVERDLWDGGDAAPAVSALLALTPEVQLTLSRVQLSPQAIVTTAAHELGWVNEVAIPGREEVYSHFDAVDVAATVSAARAAFEDVAPLGELVAPGRTSTVSRLFATLTRQVAALGVPGTVSDSAVPTAQWTAVAQEDDVVAGALGALSPTLGGYGPRQLYGYGE